MRNYHMSSPLLNETNIEITEVTIPEDESLQNVDMFVKTMGYNVKDLNHPDPAKIIRAINDRKIIIKGVRNESYAIAQQLHWKMIRTNPKK